MTRIFTAAALLVTIAATPAPAHHPFGAEYDWNNPVTVTGTVQRFEWKNPHSMMQVTGKDDGGKHATWTVELGSPGQLRRAGWNRKALQPGDVVTVEGWRAKNGAYAINANSVTPAGGPALSAASSLFGTDRHTADAASRTIRETIGTTGNGTTGRD